jgi:uncharacterized protein YdaU (DUF1376 family)
MHYYQHHIGDFIKATSCLSNEQMASYLRLLWMYYDSEQPLVDDPEVLALRVGSKPDDVRLILRAFFRLENGVWRQSRCDREIEEYHAICERNTNNGKRGGRPKNKPSRFPQETQSVSNGLPDASGTEPSRNPDETLTSNHKPVTNIEAKASRAQKRPTPLPADFCPNESGIAYAESRSVNVEAELERFRNNHQAKGTALKDWQAGWRTWCDKAVEFGRVGHKKPKTGEPKFGSDEYFELHRQQRWWADAGFDSVWEAANHRCHHKNAHEFRDGKKLQVAA